MPGRPRGLGLDWEGITRWRQGQRAALVDRAERGNEIIESLDRVVSSQRLVGRAESRTTRPAQGRPVEGQLGVQVVKEEVAAAGCDLVRITHGVVVDVIPASLGPPVLLGGVELLGNLRMALE